MKIKKIILSLIFILIILCTGLFIYISTSLSPINNGETIRFKIDSNTSNKKVFLNLKEEGIIKDSNIAYLYNRFINKKTFVAGSFELNSNMSVDDLINYLSNETNVIYDTITITFKEGSWLKHFASVISNNFDISYDEIINTWNNQDFINELSVEYPFLNSDLQNSNIRYPLEGYLSPDTYEFFKDSSIQTITKKLLDPTLKLYQTYLDSNNDRSFHELVTLASIIQYEAGRVEDMKDISSVFFNRLNLEMKLQSSVTVCYALDLKDDESWTKCEYNPDYNSPYNTYKYEGLPPSAICSFSKYAFDAVLNPNSTDYLYFIGDVCNNTKETIFATTYEQHLNNIKEYLGCY